jgi:hypothetical protein
VLKSLSLAYGKRYSLLEKYRLRPEKKFEVTTGMEM